MRREPLEFQQATGGTQQIEDPREQMTANDGGAMLRDFTSGDSVTHREGLLQARLDVARPDGAGMRGRELFL